MLPLSYIPAKPFDSFKWTWASKECTEGINDPMILLGVLSCLYKYNGIEKYSSEKLAEEFRKLQEDVKETAGKNVNIARKVGERNIIRNSGQYWKALGLIGKSKNGLINVTPFGCKIATNEITQADFAAITINTLELPNRRIQTEEECEKWDRCGVRIHPLKLILRILCELDSRNKSMGYITPQELYDVVIPLSASSVNVGCYADFIQCYRIGELDTKLWPNCCPEDNDKRIAREFLLFLAHYGYLVRCEEHPGTRDTEMYCIRRELTNPIMDALDFEANTCEPLENSKDFKDIVLEIERRRVLISQLERPRQRQFRENVLKSYGNRCMLTGTSMREVLQAAHIKPVKYAGDDSIGNGICLRSDLHILFDSNNMIISPSGDITLSERAMHEYGSIVPSHIDLPDFVNRDNLRWRLDNYKGI